MMIFLDKQAKGAPSAVRIVAPDGSVEVQGARAREERAHRHLQISYSRDLKALNISRRTQVQSDGLSLTGKR